MLMDAGHLKNNLIQAEKDQCACVFVCCVYKKITSKSLKTVLAFACGFARIVLQ